jgi:predicted SAM-dependent methyltransferase
MFGTAFSVARRAINAAGFDLVPVGAQDADVALYERLYPRKSLDRRAFYNIGAGGFRHRYWTNVDNESEWYQGYQGDRIGISWDLLKMQPLPIDSGTAEVVYTSHVIEHVTDEANANLFREAYRALKPGGTFRLTTPNIDLYVRAYRAGDRDFFYWTKNHDDPALLKRMGLAKPWDQGSLQQLFLYEFASSVSTLHGDGAAEKIDDAEFDRVFREMSDEQAMNYCTSKVSLDVQRKYPGNHVNWWSYAKLERMLREAGFKTIRQSAFGQSHCPVLRNTRYFDNTHPAISLYAEAVKQ